MCVLWQLTQQVEGKRLVHQWGGVQAVVAGLEAHADAADVSDVRVCVCVWW